MNQEQKVLERIKKVGYVDNFWAINNYILRLASIISRLSNKKGLKFHSSYGTGSNKKNYYYYLLK